MNPLTSRKQLLIAESELNRAQLVQEWRTMTGEVHALAGKARTISSFASAAVSLAAGLAFFRCKKSMLAAEKSSWLQAVLKGAGLISTIWKAFRPQARDRPGS
jgi:hypothetical protein